MRQKRLRQNASGCYSSNNFEFRQYLPSLLPRLLSPPVVFNIVFGDNDKMCENQNVRIVTEKLPPTQTRTRAVSYGRGLNCLTRRRAVNREKFSILSLYT